MDKSLSQELQSENPLTKVKSMFQRKYPKASLEEIMQKYLRYMKKQFEETFDSSNSMSTWSQIQTVNADTQDAQDPEDDMDCTTLWDIVMKSDDKSSQANKKGKEVA